MKSLLQLLILTTCHVIQVTGVLEWTVIGKVTDYGQNVTLFCNVSNCCPENSGWDLWTPVQRTLFIDVRTGRSNKKYDGKVLSDGYTLVIQNLTEKDLNVSYSCLYDVTLGERKLLLAEDVFTYISYTPSHIPPQSRLSDGEIAGILLGILVLLAVPVVVFFISRRPRQKSEDTNTVGQYLNASDPGKEIRRHVRIHVIGQEGVGKSSLVRRLIGKKMGKPKSTDGIDIVKECQIDPTDGKWITGNVETENQKIVQSIRQALHWRPGSDGLPESEHSLLSTEKNPLLYEEHIHSKNSLASNVTIMTESKTNVGVALNISSNEYELARAYDGGHPSGATPKNKHTKNPDKTSNFFENQNRRNTISSETITETLIKILRDNNKKGEKTTADLVECDIWDFAGQKDYYVTHQTFFSPHAIYLLVADIQEDLKFFESDATFNPKTCGEYIDYWFESVHCFSEDNTCSNLDPPVIIVCTKTDKFNDKELEDKREKDYETTFNRIFGERKWVSHCKGFHFISNLQPSHAKIEILQNAISQIAKEMKYYPEEIPISWIKLENAIRILKNLDIPVYSLESITKLADEYSIKEKCDLFDFLTYQHKIGNIIFFEDESDFIIVQPKWLVQCFRCLVCDDAKKTYYKALPAEKYKLTSYGELSDELINNLFRKESDFEFIKHQQFILNVMVKFDIIIKPKFNEFENTSYYMPCMIDNTSTVEQIIKDNLKFTDMDRTPWLVLEFHFLPIAYFNHIMFNFIRKYKVCNVKSNVANEANVDHPALFAGKAVVYLDDDKTSRLLIICFSKNAISLQIWKWEDVEPNTYKNILFDLCNDIEDLERKLKHNLRYEIKAKCSTGEYSNRFNRISYEFLSTHYKDRTYHCEEHPESDHTTVEIKNTWFRHVPTVKQELTERIKKRAEQDAVIQNDSFDQYDEVRYHPVQPEESNGIDNQGTNIANRFGHHPSNEDIETSGTSQTSDKSFRPVIATSVLRIDACKTPQPQQLDDEFWETYHVADTERSIVSSQQEEVFLPDNNFHISNPNQEEEFISGSAKFPLYSIERVREQSFTEWSLSEPSKQKMAIAGFFYKGCNTYAQCFCCGFNQKWREHDDPFRSSLHTDNCSYSQKVNNSSDQVKQELTERMQKRAEQEAVIQNDSFDQYDGVRYHPVQPEESNGIDNQGTNIANRFGHHPSNEEPIVDKETSGTPRTCFQPLIATSFARIDTCKAPQPQQSDDEDKETSHAARSVVSSQQEEVVLPDNDSHISNSNQEEDIVIISSKFPAYSKKRVREQSFVEWYLSEPSKQKMASAGFFYKGSNTYAQCFCCGFNQKWREHDNPFSSSLHNDTCLYSKKTA